MQVIPEDCNPTGIDSDPRLAPHGVEQAKELGKFISSEVNPPPQLIFSSPFYRCVETITPASISLDIPIFLERGVGEWYKKDRGIIPIPADSKTLSKFFDRLSDDWEWDTVVVPSTEGEDESDIFERCQRFWSGFIPKLEQKYPEVETILFVTHAATKIALGMSLMKYQSTRDFLDSRDGGDGETTRIRAPTCSFDHYSLDSKGEWRMRLNGVTHFLKGGDEMNWHFASGVEAGSDEDIKRRREAGLLRADESLSVTPALTPVSTTARHR